MWCIFYYNKRKNKSTNFLPAKLSFQYKGNKHFWRCNIIPISFLKKKSRGQTSVKHTKDENRSTSKHTVMELQNTRNKEKIIKALREKKQILYKGPRIRMVSDFSTVMLETRKQYGVNVFTILKKNYIQYGVLCIADIQMQISMFLDVQVVKMFTSYVLFLRKLLQDVVDQKKGVNQEKERLHVQEKRFSAKERWKECLVWLWRRAQDNRCASEVEDTRLDSSGQQLWERVLPEDEMHWTPYESEHFERRLMYLGESWGLRSW